MSDTSALETLLESARRTRDLAQARQRRVGAGLDAAAGQADQLRDYRSATQARWGEQFKAGATIHLVQCYQGFVGRLHTAVDLQGHQVERLGSELRQAQAETLAAELRVAALEKLIARRVAEQGIKTERREQKQLDEHASRMAWQHSRGEGSSAHGYSSDAAELEWQ
jgi:flagellar FliJ protein